MIRELKRRLDRLEQSLADSMPGPWPPAEGSMAFWLWTALGKPQDRRGYMDMYLERAKQFYEVKK